MVKALVLFFLFTTHSYSQVQGCTDRMAKNFDPKATQNNGSCWYAAAKVKPVYSKALSDSLPETSGLIAFDHLLWTHNDDHDTTLYGMDTLGVIQKKTNLQGLKNNDWEEITQDSCYLYIGDFGNNYTGNRIDLHILRIEKKSFLSNVPLIDTISFSYADQTDFAKQPANSTDFDCEAFVVLQDSIYLFTKQWKQKGTAVYALPKIPGNHIAQLKESYNIKGLITGATYVPHKNTIALSGYSKALSPFICLLYDYKKTDFFSGNRRKIKIALPFHQIEGIATQDGLRYYLTNEKLIRKPIIYNPQQLHSIDLSAFIADYLIR
jgi:hypothetical protein